ncbi:peptide ABC transporter substrate-binding protein [Spiroplasma taiwanense]|uniref:Oligopeptide ABC transporter substrate-binding protein n=1 Tax=Spiroplasma taiwanense CT-1 TaxID=1276220 RepID=S5M0E7_9MOLU|nr:peptide ABC transporter substrate-binding protein [Spiroplasma taiwanense]AGR41467.1 oligopeptide ABC transporter substrate-binding protein [Spiroplasma taiwanense CT-1]
MEIKLRRLLSAISAVTLVSTTTSSVVACKVGFDFASIRNKKINTKEYVAVYTAPPKSWNPIATSSASDTEYLANIFGTILSVDEYGRTYGDLVESAYAGVSGSSSGKSIYVGNDSTNSNIDLTTWKYKLRDEAYWYKADGSKVRRITAGDFLNSAKFALTPANNVATSFLWLQFIKGANEVSTAIGRLKDATLTFDQIIEKVKSGYLYTVKDANGNDVQKNEAGIADFKFGIIADDGNDGYNVTFHLEKPAPYFESLLTYNVFSPSPIENYANGANGVVPDPSKTLFSGPYLPNDVENILNGTKMVFKKNNSHYFANKTEIETIIYKKITTQSTDLTRTLFETGETISYNINPADAVGWERYVGSDINNPKIDEVSVGKALSTQTFALSYNTNYNSGAVDDAAKISGSKLLQFNEARAFISTGFNRNVLAKYYSEKYDSDPNLSGNVRNTFTAPELTYDANGKDYVKYIEDSYKEKFGAKPNSVTTLVDGTDSFLNKESVYVGKTKAELVESISKFIEENNLTKNSKGKIELEYVGSDTHNTSINPYLTRTIAQFNEIPNNPIEIKFNILAYNDYLQAYFGGKFHLFNIAWTPDFSDPGSFVGTLGIDGDLSKFTGFQTELSSSTPLLLKRDDASEGVGEENLTYKVNDKFKTTVSDSFVASIEDTTDKFYEIDRAEKYDLVERLKGFGELETEIIYENFYVLPNFNAAPLKSYSISYLRQYTYGYATYGVSPNKLFTRRINEQLWTKQQLKDWSDLYKAEKEKINTDISYKKNGNIFYED